MIFRYLFIVFLSVRLIYSYLLVLFVGKRKKSILLVPSFAAFGGTRTYFIYLIEFLSQRDYSIVVMLTEMQCDAQVVALQAQFKFTIHKLEFEITPTHFTGTVFYKRNQLYFIYHLKELIYFWKQLFKYKCAHLVVSEANPELLL